ncbi:cell wall hydrolase, partial [Patescibacteria group bacterium]|nr:cell wall hydrolase [Patescibacteria group bacterium]
LKSIRIYQIEESEISFLPKDNYPIEDGERRQWLTIVLVSIGIKSLKIKALANIKKRGFLRKDDSDLKLLINDEIQKNEELKSHKNWYWCGRALKGKSKLFEKELNLKPELHYLEFWADRNPEIKEIRIKIEEFKRIPTVDDPKWTGNFEDDSEEMILARVIYGEARSESRETKTAVSWSVRHRVEMGVFGGNTYHAVILKPNQYASFREVDKNYNYVIDPLHKNNPIDEKTWRESWEIASHVIKGEIEDFSEGANFFHDVSLSQEDFLRIVPGARFTKRSGRLLFYFSER